MSKRQHDIERYLRGEMTAAEMHALEREALHDPFLADALEGASQTGADNFLVDLQDIRSSLTHRHRAHKPKIISIWNWSIGIAAGLILIAMSGIYIVTNLKQRQMAEKQVAMNAEILNANLTDTLDVLYTVQAQQREAAMAQFRTENSARVQQVRAENQSSRLAQREVEARLTEAPVLNRDQEQARTELAIRPRVVTSKVIRGKVTSTEDGSALPGVNVTVSGTNEGVFTDQNGEYELKTTSEAKTLDFAFIGMKPQQLKIGTRTELNVKLAPDYSSLTEIVVADDGEKITEGESLEMAHPNGGKEAYSKYLQHKMNYPKQALEHKIEGNVTIQFTVDHNGQLADFEVLKGLGFGCEDELIRLVKEGPAWSPSTRDSKPIAGKVKVGMKFDIPDEKK